MNGDSKEKEIVGDRRNPVPVLTESKLEFFYGILTLWESGVRNKVVNNFKSKKVKRFLARKDSKGVAILSFKSNVNEQHSNCKYELSISDVKHNYGLSLLYHLRNAFAHNTIRLNGKGEICIDHKWQSSWRIKARVSSEVLKEFIDILTGTCDESKRDNKKSKSKKLK